LLAIFSIVFLLLAVLMFALPGIVSVSTFVPLALGLFIGSLLWGFSAYFIFKATTHAEANSWFARIINDSNVPKLTFTLSPLTISDIIGAFSMKRLLSMLLSSERLTLRALHEIMSPITHVFTSTDLYQGEHFHFSKDWVLSMTYHEQTKPGDVQICEAV